MSLAIVYSRASFGIHAPLVIVEAHLLRGMSGLNIVGLPETAVKESKDRVRSAMVNTQFDFPARRITINLAPADLPKEGSRFDLPIALGILAATKQIPANVLKEYECLGELALSGELRPVHGILPVVLAAHRAGRSLIIPRQNAEEASLVEGANILAADHLLEVCAHLRGGPCLKPYVRVATRDVQSDLKDMIEVKGQPHAKRALEIAAAGKHSVLFLGPPGTGKTMLASRLPTILPNLSDEQALEVASIASVSSNGFKPTTWKQIPFRSPHHSSSSIALVGGGRPPKPGEISLAHHGVLFLDELPEFSRQVLECLREPLESGHITISRAAYQTVFPSQFQLVAAMNPCPCGYAGSRDRPCDCTNEQVRRYRTKISGPLLDRIDMHVTVSRVSADILSQHSALQDETSEMVLNRVIAARAYQLARQHKLNSQISVKEIEKVCALDAAAQQLLSQAMTKFNFSARVYHRIVKLARTIADLAGLESIKDQHIGEALLYRSLDREAGCVTI